MDQNELYDLQTVEIMRRILQEDSNCIDVGCHRGVMLDEILQVAPNGHHFAFEPIPELHAELTRKYAGHGNIEVSMMALSDVSGQTTFQHVVSNPAYSGLKRRRYDRPNEVVQEIVAQTCRLDEIIPESMRIAFIKIDVEGAELQVLRGALELIRQSRPAIVFEHGLGAADYFGTSPEDVFDLLTNAGGLRCFTMKQWLESAGARDLSRQDFCERFRLGRDYYFLAAA